ncbi:DUF4397 domain-containing protein [Romboutsia sp.]|uniref:DUF4397 domain-containing protein n=1 Tax=Romboutsia sp. TaxID=1965302 RepID=UPI002CC9EE74|nr:DUF4397 domain-containing protein [Romboutsia sp.]HSQ90465.1 DUF4397 domain-containing protein [Romboutsia sp.]
MDCFKIKEGSSLVRVFHASPQAPKVDVYIDGNLAFSDLGFKEFTNYVYLDEGSYKVEVYPAGTKENAAISEIVDVPDGEIVTVAATGNLDDLSLLVIPDYVSKETSDSYSTFRVIHLSPDAPAVDILVDEDVLFEDIEFREGTEYVDVKPGKYNITIALSSDGKSVLSFEVTLNPNRIYTIYAVGDAANLRAIQSVDGNTYVCK